MGSHDIDGLYYMDQRFEVFINIWPDDGLIKAEISSQHLK